MGSQSTDASERRSQDASFVLPTLRFWRRSNPWGFFVSVSCEKLFRSSDDRTPKSRATPLTDFEKCLGVNGGVPLTGHWIDDQPVPSMFA